MKKGREREERIGEPEDRTRIEMKEEERRGRGENRSERDSIRREVWQARNRRGMKNELRGEGGRSREQKRKEGRRRDRVYIKKGVKEEREEER